MPASGKGTPRTPSPRSPLRSASSGQHAPGGHLRGGQPVTQLPGLFGGPLASGLGGAGLLLGGHGALALEVAVGAGLAQLVPGALL